MEKMEIKEYLQELLDKWNKYDELDGFTAYSFRNDLEKLLEYWDLRIKEEPVRIFYAGDMCVGSSNKPKKQPEEKCIHYFPLSSEGVCQKCGIKFEDIKSEKQEEWRKEWRKLSFEIESITKHQADEIEGFISYLLEEREKKLKKSILKDFKKFKMGYIGNVGEYGIPDSLIQDILENMEEKLSKLLKKKNEDH